MAPPFDRVRYRFPAGAHASEPATIQDDQGAVLLTYRGFALASRTVTGLVSGLVAASGTAATLFLATEDLWLETGLVAALTIVFTWLIDWLKPRLSTRLEHEGRPLLVLTDRPHRPGRFLLLTLPDRVVIAEFQRTLFSRLGRHRWIIRAEKRRLGYAIEEQLSHALLRKILGRFSRRFQTDLRIVHQGAPAGRIVRRFANPARRMLLQLDPGGIDARIAVGLATLIIGTEG